MYLRDKKVVNPNPEIKKLFEENNLGQKSGKGFYDYKGDKYERINLTEEQAQTYDPIKLVQSLLTMLHGLFLTEFVTYKTLKKHLSLGWV